MQILYIAREPLDAESAASVLRGAAPDVNVLWASRFDQADVWVDHHHDLAALLIDAEAGDLACAAFLTSTRKRGINAAIVVITPEGSRSPGELLRAGADDCAEKGESFSRGLSAALDRALERARTQGAGRWDYLRVERPASAERATDAISAAYAGSDMAADRLTECQASVEATIASLFPAANDSCSALSSRLADVDSAFDALTAELADSRERIERLTAREAELDARLAQETEALTALTREMLEVRAAAEDAARASRNENSALAARIHTLNAERVEAAHAFEAERRSFEETLGRASSEHAAACGRFEQQLCEAELALEALRREQTWAVAENERLTRREAELSSELEASRAMMRRSFEESPLPMCRCTPNGRLTHANRAFAQLVGRTSADDLRNADVGEVVFESADDLRWLVDRADSASAPATIETTWRTKDGNRLIVRVSALAMVPGAIEMAAEDLTNVRSLEERLGPAQRMESVGRLASEVAVTCANLLGDVHQDVQRWMRTGGSDAALRHQGEMVMEEVTRASGFLRQLAAYGDEQASALSPVDLNKVLRHLGPVLKQVVGDEVELELPKTATPLIVDVPNDRVERLLVNLAAYGRERMPFGGRLKIEVGTATVDQAFIEKYPNVRRGQHALLTATETRRTVRAEGPLRLREWTAGVDTARQSSVGLGVDLGALQGLIRECGGHLWVTAVPHGDMEVRIHLPLRSTSVETQPHPPAVRGTTLGLTGSLLTRH